MDGTSSGVFYRNFKKHYSVITRGHGMYLYDSTGRRYLDAVGGAGVVVIGHGVPEITAAMAERAEELCFVYSATFSNQWQEELANALLSIAPKNMRGIWFVSGGSEANETAVKMARQYHLERGNPSKYKMISRWQSYHGMTLAALALSGRPSWQRPFAPYLHFPVTRIVPPYCYRCPFGRTYPDCGVACADDLERAILQEGPETVSAFIAEPIIGTTVTGVVPVPEYYSKVREICDRYDVLFIVDEVLTGYGRSGTPSAIEQWGVDADIITWSKAIASGYTPLAAVLASERVVDAFRDGSGQFVHGFTYSGNPMSCFIGLQVFRYMRQHDLFDRPAPLGAYLEEKLKALASRHSLIGDVRGRGLLFGLEFVQDRATKEPVSPDLALTERIVSRAQEMGVMVIPGVRGANYGRGGDHIQISPPYIIERDQIDQVVDVLDKVLTEIEAEL